MAGFKPMRVTMASAFRATLTIVRISTIHGRTSKPLGTVARTDSSILKKITFVTIKRHMLPNIRHQPVKISEVLLLPPMAKASGAVIVSMARMTYRSAISKRSLNTLNITIMPKIMTSSHAAPMAPNTLSSTNVTLTASGIWSSSMIFDVILSPISQICGLASSKNAKTKVRAKSSFGSSPSKPSPTAILLSA